MATEATDNERRSILLRLPADLHDEVRIWADEDERSVTWLITAIIRRSVQGRKGAAARNKRPDTEAA